MMDWMKAQAQSGAARGPFPPLTILLEMPPLGPMPIPVFYTMSTSSPFYCSDLPPTLKEGPPPTQSSPPTKPPTSPPPRQRRLTFLRKEVNLDFILGYTLRQIGTKAPLEKRPHRIIAPTNYWQYYNHKSIS